MSDINQVPENPCAGCLNHDRRAFIQSAAATIAAIVGVSAVSAVDAAAAGISSIVPLSAGTRDTRYPIPVADGVNIDAENDVIIARAQGKAYAFALSCPHQNTQLRWYEKDHRFQCPKHKSRYKPTGEFIEGRATRNMDRLPIKLEGNMLIVDVAHEIRSDEEAAKWAAAVVTLPA